MKLKQLGMIEAYGDAGSVVHLTLENHYESPFETTQNYFNAQWHKFRLHDTNPGMFGKLLEKDPFWKAVETALCRRYKILKYEEKFEFNDCHKIKGFVDVIAKAEDRLLTDKDKAIINTNPKLYSDHIIVDWKSNSAVKPEHIGQQQFYAYLWYRQHKTLPKKFIWDYVKIDKKLENTFTFKDVLAVRDKIDRFVKDIYKKQSIHDWLPALSGLASNCAKDECFWCGHKAVCKAELAKQIGDSFKIIIKKGRIYFGSPTSPDLDAMLDKEFSYEVANKEFMIKLLKKRGREWDGIKNLRKYNSYPMGIYHRLVYVIEQYFKKQNINIDIITIDTRKEFQKVDELMPKLKGFNMRYYQNEAIDAIMDKKIGIIKCPTGTGKTVLAADIFRRKPTKTLFVVDVKVLLKQSKDELEDALDMKDQIGTITAGTMDIKSNLTICTIQTIVSLIKKKDKKLLKYLDSLETVISDETHLSKSLSYSKLFSKATNCQYRVGLTGTPNEDANDFLELNKNMGYVVYHVPTQQMIDEGYLIRPTIKFLKYHLAEIPEGTYQEIQEQLFKNTYRNQKVIDVCVHHNDKIILVLVTRISQGLLIEEELKKAGRDCFFIRGEVDDDNRDLIIKEARDGHTRVIIGTSGIVAKGLNIKPLEIIVNCAGNSTDVMTIQSLGRGLRICEGKTSMTYYDMHDEIDYFQTHTFKRIRAFKKEGHEVQIIQKGAKFYV